MYFETPYYLAPDKRGHKGYALLRDTLKRTGKAGIANVVIRTRQYVAALIPLDGVIVMNTLRYADEIRSADEFEVPPEDLKAVGVTPKEIEMAAKLVDGMTERWQPDRYHDTYHEDLLALIEKRVQAGQTEVITEPSEEEEAGPPKGEVVDLMALLKRSVEEKAKGHHAAAPGKARRKSSRKAA